MKPCRIVKATELYQANAEYGSEHTGRRSWSYNRNSTQHFVLQSAAAAAAGWKFN